MKSTEFARQMGKDAPRRRDTIDLHMHSTFSDGMLKVPELIDFCVEQGLAAMAVTDHDNIDSFEEGRVHAQKAGIEYIPGVEISSWMDGSDIHILGYLFDHTHLRLNQILVELRDKRRDRAEKIVARLEAVGVHINLERILEKSAHGSVGRAHIANQMVEEEYVANFQEAFNRYLGNGSDIMGDIDNAKLTPADAIQLILEAGGVPVLAHPSKTGRDDLIAHLVESGLMGIEVFCCSHSHTTQQRYRDVALRYDLICCGGADFHVKREDGRNAPGSVNVPYGVLDKMRSRQVTRI
jgi:3',5'-nucleoside bisphosphate phosphatase